MQGLIIGYLDRYYIVSEHNHGFGVFNHDTCFPVNPITLINELCIVFSIDVNTVKPIVQLWATFLDIKNDLTKYWESDPNLVYMSYLIMNGEPTAVIFDDFSPKTALMSRYRTKVIDPSRYGILDGRISE